MTKGNLQTRLPNYPIAEFHAVTKRFNQMATALELGIKENNRLALSINQSSDALFLTNTDGMINFWNPAAEKLFEYQGEGFRNQNIRLISPNNLIHEIDTNLENILNLEHRDAFETLRKTKSGRKIEVSEKVTPIVEPETNSILGTLFVIRDLSEKRAAEKTKLELEKNRELTTVVQKRLEEERKALAMELHDELGQYVTAIKTIATSIANRSKDGDKKVYSSSTAIVSAAGQIYDAVHNIIRRLRPITLERFGLIETLKETIDELLE
jgi:PAS domain S-box-containing protein